jgi:glycosyltransferase involved in cell wall biosynthesis
VSRIRARLARGPVSSPDGKDRAEAPGPGPVAGALRNRVASRLGAEVPRRMRPPDGHRPYRALTVADVDLSSGVVTVVPPVHTGEHLPEGVHALVWFHGVPVGEVTVAGDPVVVLESLPTVAAAAVQQPVLQHLLTDALATPGALRSAGWDELARLAHPVGDHTDASHVTVAVCTRDRPEDLSRCLAALARLDPPPAEVLVIDNAPSDDRTEAVVRSSAARYVREPRPGLDWARNRALLEAGTPIVAFTDDDVLVHPHWLRGVVLAFAEEQDAVVVTGLVAPAELITPAQVLFEAQGGFGRGYVRKWMSVAVADGESAARRHPGTGDAGTGANMAVRRDEALALGGFDTALDVGTATGGGGDLEFYFRVLAAGGLVVYEPAAVVRHVHRLTMRGLDRQMHGFGTGSYSIFAGAGLGYGRAHAAEFLLFGVRWVLQHHLRMVFAAVVRPRLRPWSMVRAEGRGMVDAVARRLYARARQRADELSLSHPSEPAAAQPVRVGLQPRPPRGADDVVTVDVLDDGMTTVTGARVRPGRRVRVRVLRDGRPQAVFAIPSGGRDPSAARLRHELVTRVGPALLEPGASWEDVLTRLPDGGVGGDVLHPDGWTESAGAAVDELTVSVLMATRDRPDMLQRSVGRLLDEAAGRPVQLVVVDNSADPTGTRAALADLPGVQVLHEPRPGLSAARNAGLSALTGDVVVFIDDDVTVTTGWLDELLRPFADPDVWAVAGNVLPADIETLAPQYFEDYGGLGRGPWRVVYRPDWLRNTKRAVPTWLIGATANAAVRRAAMEQVGPFNEVLGAGRPAGVGEDSEYFYRILRTGGVIVYQPTSIVLHWHRADLAALQQQLTAYSSGHVAHHLEVLSRYRDARGLHRVAVTLPLSLAVRWWRLLRGRDDYPAVLLMAETTGHLRGLGAWSRSRRGRR